MADDTKREKAYIHYLTRAQRRPQQVFNPKTNSWEHFDKEPK